MHYVYYILQWVYGHALLVPETYIPCHVLWQVALQAVHTASLTTEKEVETWLTATWLRNTTKLFHC